MKKQITSLFLTLCLIVGLMSGAVPQAYAANQGAESFTYDVEAAITYAKNYTGSAECAEFVSRCVKAGGINISVQTGTGPCYRAIGRYTGLAPVAEADRAADNTNNLPYLPKLVLDTNGNATKAENSGVLQRGDVVVQWCYTHNISPHILLCGGYDSDGNATFYARNSRLNNGTYNLARNTSSNHTTRCDMGAKVLRLSSGGNSEAVNTISAPPAPSSLTATAASANGNTARITWGASSVATSYKVQYWSPNNNTWISDPDYRSGTSYTSTGLSVHSSYKYRVCAENAAGVSAWTEVVYYKNNEFSIDGYPARIVEKNMTVNVGAGNTLRLANAPTSNNTALASIPHNSTVYVYGSTIYQYPNLSGTNITWAKVYWSGVYGWVNLAWLR